MHLSHYLNRIAPTAIIEVTVVAYFSFISGSLFNHLFLSSHAATGGLWSAISGIFIIHELKSNIIRSAYRRLLGTLIGTLTSAALFSLLNTTPAVMAFAIVITIVICQLLAVPNLSKIACITIAVMLFVGNLYEVTPWMNAFLRFSETFIGGGIAVLVAYSMRWLKFKIE